MGLRKKSDNKVTSISAMVSISFYVIIAAIFWNVGGGEIIKEFVVTATKGKKPPPPPPPKRTPKKVKMSKPPKIRPKFDAPKVSFSMSGVRPDFGKMIIPTFSNEDDLSDFTRMAKKYDANIISESIDQAKTAALDIGSKLGLGLGDFASGKSVVVGRKKRTRAKITLAFFAKARYYEERAVVDGAIETLNATSIKATSESKNLKWNETFELWFKECKTKLVSVRGTEIDVESEFIKRFGREISFLEQDKLGYVNTFTENIKKTWRDYLIKKYPMAYEKTGDSNASSETIYAQAKKLYKLFPHAVNGVRKCNQVVSNFTSKDIQNEYRLKKILKPIYQYLRSAEIQNYPIVIAMPRHEEWNDWGYKYNEENIGYLRDYARNGGFIYVDDIPIPFEVNEHCRRMVGRIIRDEIPKEEEKLLKKTFKKLAASDRKVAGYKLGSNFPNPFHPLTYIPYTVPKVCDVTFHIYNRIGKLVRSFTVSGVEPGRYGTKNEALQWDCLDEAGQPVESGGYFIQMSSGLFQQTNRAHMDDLRKLDPARHSLFSSYHQFKGVPLCGRFRAWHVWNNQYPGKKPAEREYGSIALGWEHNKRIALLYTEWSGIVWVLKKPNIGSPQLETDNARRFFTNVIVFAITQKGGVTQRM